MVYRWFCLVHGFGKTWNLILYAMTHSNTPVRGKREWLGWAGIVGRSIHTTVESDSNYRIKAIYPSRRTAKLAYESVIKVKIVEVK